MSNRGCTGGVRLAEMFDIIASNIDHGLFMDTYNGCIDTVCHTIKTTIFNNNAFFVVKLKKL